MKSVRLIVLSGAALLVLSGCDFVRFPGDGGPSPETPQSGPAVPPGAPGPPPPSAPVDDPYGNGEPGEPETPDPGTPDTGTPGTEDPATNPVSDPEDDDGADGPSSGLDTPPGSDTGETPDTEPGSGPDAAPGEEDTGETDPDDAPPAEPGRDDENLPDTDTDTGSDTPAEPGTEDDDPAAPDDTADTPTAPEPADPVFSYFEAGALLPGTGQGAPDQIVYAPDMVFPIAGAPAYLQSQVFNFGGGVAGGDQCDSRNYAYPWRDNFCETRSANRGTPYCPQNRVHQGQDIRVGSADSCNRLRSLPANERTLQKVVAVEDGIISHVGTYSVNLRAGGRIYKYMHMNMDKLQVKAGDPVQAGDHIGYVSNDFGGTPTTFHLHFEITQNGGNGQWVHVPPYLSLVEAYERRENGPGERIEPGAVAVATTPFIIPEGMEIIE